MLHPSYTDLMKVVNSDVEPGETNIVNSRYSIVLATAKRARQIIAGAESAVPDYKNKKPLSVAVDELMNGDVKILSSGEDADDEDEQVDEDVEEDEPRGYAVQKTVNAVLAVLSVVLFFLTQPLVWRFRFVDWWTVLFVLLCGTALAMLIWKRKEENKAEETDEEETEDFAE